MPRFNNSMHVPASRNEFEAIPKQCYIILQMLHRLRPISLTTTLSKVWESFVFDWLISSIRKKSTIENLTL